MNPTRLVLATLPTLALHAPASAQYLQGYDLDTLGVDDAEFTPNGRLVVARDNTEETACMIYDAKTGQRLLYHISTAGLPWGGPCEDAVVCTDTNAVVIGTAAMFLDLTQPTMPPIAEHDVGPDARDIALSPDGTMVAVRGTSSMFLFDMASGALLVSVPAPAPIWVAGAFEVDSVVMDDDHAVFTSYTPMGDCRVHVFDLHPTGGGPPALVFQTSGANDQSGTPHDIEMTPDGQHAIVRSDYEVGLYSLNGASSGQAWVSGVWGGFQQSFGGSAMDSLVCTNDFVASISRRPIANPGAQVDVWELPTGTQHYDILLGDPHDLALTPDGDRLLVRTHRSLYMYDTTSFGGPLMFPLAQQGLTGNWTSWNAGLDSLSVTAERVLAISRVDNESKVRVYDITGDTFEKVFGTKIPEEATDVAITPSQDHAIVSGISSVLVVDLRLDKEILYDNMLSQGTFPWCDGVAVTDDHAAVFGALCCDSVAFGGWITIVDLFSRSENYCVTNPNSTGADGQIVATGSSRYGENDLTLTAKNLPAGEFGQFVYGSQTQQVPYSDGFVCVSGQVARFPVQVIGGAGRAQLGVDNQMLPPGGGALFPGSTWHFQFVHRDTAGGGGFNFTDGVSVLFE